MGVSNWAAWQIAKALGVAERLNATQFQSVQAYYSLANRELEREIVPVVEAERLGLLVYSPLAGGYLSGKYRDETSEGKCKSIEFPPVDQQKGEVVLSAMDDIAAAHGVSMVAVALAWLLDQRAVTSVILGVKRLEQLDINIVVTQVTLTDDDLQTLNAASKPSEYPGWIFATSELARQELLKSGRLSDRH